MPRQAGTRREYIDLSLPSVCRKLSDALGRKGWTQRDLGRMAGVEEKAAGKLLDPRTFGEPQLATVAAVTKALGLSLDGLFGLPASNSKIPRDEEEPIAWIVAKRGITRRQLGADAGLSPQTISNIAGRKSCDFFSAIAIARAAGVSLDSLTAALLR